MTSLRSPASRPIAATGRGFVIRPSAALVTAYVGACAIWLIGVLVSARYPTIGTPLHMISGTTFLGLSAINLFALIALILDARGVGSRPGDFRRSRLFGLGLSAVNLLLLQTAIVLAYEPFFLATMRGG